MATDIATPMATMAMVQSTIAAQEAEAAHRIECQNYTDKFDAHGASVESQLQYAECVQLLHPQPMSKEHHHTIQICIVVALICGIIGAWKVAADSYDDPVIEGMLGFFVGAVLVAPCLIALGFGILYLFT